MSKETEKLDKWFGEHFEISFVGGNKKDNKMLYVWWKRDDNCIDIYNTGNIYNEVEDETTTEHFNQL